MSVVLTAAALYNMAWGAFVVLFPREPFRWAGMREPNYPQLWQCIGMIVGVYGIGYALAARDPMRHWPIVLVGLLGKVFGPIGFLQAALDGDLPWVAGWTILTNDLIWWVPFAAILWRKYREHLDEDNTRPHDPPLEEAIGKARDRSGRSLSELSESRPVLLVFLRHFG
jgi:hypothetical protein